MARIGTTGVLAGLSNELAGVVEKVGPSVVRVDDGSDLTATGIVWEADGVILTTSHGVERDEDVAIELSDGRRLPATVAGRDGDTDLAVLRVTAETGLPAIERAGLEDIKVGHLALAIGRPGSAGLQATIGIVSARIESQTGGTPEYILHTDAVLYPGFSGGPLVDTSGRVVGIVDRLYGRGSGVAIGVPIAERVAKALATHGRVPRGYLGIRTQLVGLPARVREDLGTGQDRGLLIVQVEPNSPAEQGGLLLGDTLLAVDGNTLSDPSELRRYLPAGQPVTLRVLRGGELQDVTVTPGAAE